MTFNLAMIQMHVVGGERQRNLTRATTLVTEAAEQGADLVVLPEVLDLGWTHPFELSDVGPIPDGDTCHQLCDMARQNVIYLCAGLVERTKGDQTYNAAVLIGPSGKVLLHHRKINELNIAKPMYAHGNRLGVANTDLGAIGLMICADAFIKDEIISRTLGVMGAQIIVSPCAWAVEADHDNQADAYGPSWQNWYGKVAKESSLWIAGVSNVGPMTAGPWQGRKCIGCSLLVGPDGEPVIQGDYGDQAERIIFAEIKLTERNWV